MENSEYIMDDFAAFIKDIFEISDKDFNMDLVKDDITSWDSLKHMELITGLEKKYDIELEVMDIVTMQSIPAIMHVLKEKGVNLG